MSSNVSGGEAPRRDHYTVAPLPWVAGCSDVGSRHSSNQDALSVAASQHPFPQAVLVVSDGVSTSWGAERASLVAADTACDVLASALQRGELHTEDYAEAFKAAHQAVLNAAGEMDPAACTLVAATLSAGVVRVGNVGDSRAYWVSQTGTSWLLTQDDSMAQARMQLGMSRQEAEQSLQAHSITRWLGRNAENVTPTLVEFRPDSPGWLVVCSDGLWNYASSAGELASVVLKLAIGHRTPVELAAALVDWANSCGGRDNITVALARFDG